MGARASARLGTTTGVALPPPPRLGNLRPRPRRLLVASSLSPQTPGSSQPSRAGDGQGLPTGAAGAAGGVGSPVSESAASGGTNSASLDEEEEQQAGLATSAVQESSSSVNEQQPPQHDPAAMKSGSSSSSSSAEGMQEAEQQQPLAAAEATSTLAASTQPTTAASESADGTAAEEAPDPLATPPEAAEAPKPGSFSFFGSGSGSSDEDGPRFQLSGLLQPGALFDLNALRQSQPPGAAQQEQQEGLDKQAPAQQQHQPQPGRPVMPPTVPALDAATAAELEAPLPSAAHIGTLWGLLVLSLAYLHHSTSGFALPALLPIISEDLHLSDNQGALLTAGYTVLYALTLVPMGLLADRVDRPKLLAGGIALWSLLTMAASETRSFGQLLATRVGFAAAQATQNPICFSLIPELFPKNRTTAMAVYNTAIYAGRALSFAALILAGQLGVPQGVIGDIGVEYTLVPLDKVDLSLVSILYTQGDYAAVTPVFTYAFDAEEGVPIESAFSAWRTLLRWLGPPGLVMAALALLTVEEPRQRGRSGRFMPLLTLSKESIDEADLNTPIGQLGQQASLAPTAPPQGASAGKASSNGAAAAGSTAVASAVPAAAAGATTAEPLMQPPHPALEPGTLISAPEQAAPGSIGESLSRLRGLVADPAFLALTLSAAFNDVGSWALVSWQATFYQRVYELQPSVYAPLLAVVIPVGGIIGGVGAGAFGDWLNRIGARGWLTAGSCIAAAPLIAVSLLVPDYKQSFAALLVGFALSECWRAPAAVMVREVSPPGLGSTASAMHLCIRNLVGGLGPIGVALLSARVGLQVAMLLVPACYLISGLGLAVTEGVIKSEREKRHAEHVQLLHMQAELAAAAAMAEQQLGSGGPGNGAGSGAGQSRPGGSRPE